MRNMSELGKYTGVNHGSNTGATNKVLSDGNELFYLNSLDKSYTIMQ